MEISSSDYESSKVAKKIDDTQLEIALKAGGSVFELDNNNIRIAAERIFDGKCGISKEFYEKTVIQGNYSNYDLDFHGLPFFLTDTKLLTSCFNEAFNQIQYKIGRSMERVLFMGAGSGRLTIPSIELAKKFGIQEIVFNDLLSSHIDSIRNKVAKCYDDSDQIHYKQLDGNEEVDKVLKVSYLPGDIVTIAQQINEKFDAIFSMWFVTPEIAEFSDVHSLRYNRELLYGILADLLHDSGIFVEDVPFSENIGFYYFLRLKTSAILREMGILKGEEDNLCLSNFSNVQSEDGGFPFHIRYIPPNGKHREELNMAGFNEISYSIEDMATGIKLLNEFRLQFCRESTNELKIDPMKIVNFFHDKTVNEILHTLRALETQLIYFPNISNAKPRSLCQKKQKKVHIWQKNH